MKKLDKLYMSKVLNDKDLDERYFMNQNVKMKTPLKMIYSPFGSRTGPMQRTHNHQVNS